MSYAAGMSTAFDWNLLRSFLAVMREGSLGKAALVLGASQPSLGRHIKQLEAQLGVELFERHARRFVPTPFAQQVLASAAHMEGGASQLTQLIAARRADATRTVRISSSRMTGLQLLPPLLAAPALQQAGVNIELHTDDRVSNLIAREADIAVRLVKSTQQSLIVRRVGSVRFGMYAARNYLAQRPEPRKLEDLAGHTIVGFDRSQLMIRGARRMGLALGRGAFAFRSDDRAVHWAAIRAGIGIGVLPTYLQGRDPLLVRVLPDQSLRPSGLWLVALREVLTRPHVKRVFDTLRDGLSETLRAAPE
jgi:DNA-binding transcriptional LysR family regulator